MNITVMIVGVLFLVPGLIGLFFPNFMLMFGHKWRFRDATPTDNAVSVAQIVGILAVSVGVLIIFAGLFWDYVANALM